MMKNINVKTDKITFFHMFYMFLFGCLFGWIVEFIWSLGKRHMFYNHSAFILGPFDIVYGFAALMLTIILNRFKKCNNFIIFIVSFVAGTVLEYAASFGMEKLLGMVAWNYSSKFMHINGRVCLAYSLFWGILGIIWVRLAMPRVLKIIDKIDIKAGTKFMKIMLCFLAVDGILTLAAVDRAKKYEEGIPPSNIVDKCFDKYFGVDYLNNMYNNRWKKID